ncbi:substrate-binding domain-containing protein [Vibrio sp.]|nr:substrate-binding domain-containing protein [Vibrio sp.]
MIKHVVSTNLKKKIFTSRFKSTVVSSLVLTSLGMGLASVAHAEEKMKVYVSFGFYGNTWMKENRNMMTAFSKSKDYKDKIDLHVQVVDNGDAQRQAQQINAMIEAGADVIVIYPSSPTALNRSIKNACRQGITVMTWDSTVTEKCATNVHADNAAQATTEAKWVAERVKGKGNVLMINGLNGTAASDERVVAAKKFWKENYPDINVVGEVEGKWTDPIVREEVSKFMALRSWDSIDVAFAQLGCAPFYSLQDEAGIPDEKKVPCAGAAENAELLALVPKDADVPGATDTYRARGIDGFGHIIGPALGVKAMKLGIDAHEQDKKLPHDIIIEAPVVTKANVKLCKTGSYEEMSQGCNVFPPSIMPNPETHVGVYDKEIPQVALKAALDSQPEY